MKVDKKLTLYIALSMLIFVSCKQTNNKDESKNNGSENCAQSEMLLNELSDEEIADGWILLYDGKSSEGWRGFKQESFPDKGWHATDGSLMIEYSGTGEQGFAGDIITKVSYSNFDLKLEWKISPGGNSGILFNVTESPEYSATWHTAHEIQVLDEFGYDEIHNYTPTLKQISGALYDLIVPKRAMSLPVGEWNKVRIKLENGHLSHWLNDVLVIDTQLWTDEWKAKVAGSKFNVYPDFGLAKEGHIGLQDHGQQVWYRNIKIKEL